MELGPEGKEEIALAIFLWKEFKSGGKLDINIQVKMHQLAKYLGVEKELEKIIKYFIWPIEIKIKE